MYKNIFDTHAHYDDERFSDDISKVLAELPSAGICGIVNCATDISSCKKSAEIAAEYDYIYFSAGIHPHESSEADDSFIEDIKSFIENKKCVAIGEIGLDYHYDFPPRDIQKDVFEKQIFLAKELDIPVIIHDREAHADIWEILKRYRPKGIVHCFSGSVEMAKDIVGIGMYIGLGGAVTFKNAKKPVEVAKYVPIDRLLLETDCPYMSPVPFRGKRNDSSLIKYTAEFLAEIRNTDTQTLLDKTCENAKIIFSLCE